MPLLELDFRVEKNKERMAGTRTIGWCSVVVWLMAGHLLVASAMEQLDTGKNHYLSFLKFISSFFLHFKEIIRIYVDLKAECLSNLLTILKEKERRWEKE